MINLMRCLALCIRKKTEETPQDWGTQTGYIQQRRIIDKIFKSGVYDVSKDFDKKVRKICKTKGKSTLNKISIHCLTDLVEH